MAHAIDTLTRALKAGDVMGDDVQAALSHLAACEDTLKGIAVRMAGKAEWDADMLEDIADDVANVAPHPGGVLEGRDPATGVGPAERYLHDMSEFGFVVYQGDAVWAQGIDDDQLGEWEGEEG